MSSCWIAEEKQSLIFVLTIRPVDGKSSAKNSPSFPDVAIAVETKHGAVIERLMERECCIFPVHPRSAKGYRQRKVPSGNKTDQRGCLEPG